MRGPLCVAFFLASARSSLPRSISSTTSPLVGLPQTSNAASPALPAASLRARPPSGQLIGVPLLPLPRTPNSIGARLRRHRPLRPRPQVRSDSSHEEDASEVLVACSRFSVIGWIVLSGQRINLRCKRTQNGRVYK
jgi:hypothetical protein